jgi:hypothetical protein
MSQKRDMGHPFLWVDKKQIPRGNDRKKGKTNGNHKSNGNSNGQNAGISPLRVRKSANASVEMTGFGWRGSG